MSAAKRIWRAVLAVPGAVLVVCMFLPAMRVCDQDVTPASCPLCWGAYLGGAGVVAMMLCKRVRLRALGAALTPMLAVLTAGGCGTAALAYAGKQSVVFEIEACALGAVTIGIVVSLARAFLRRPPGDASMAALAVLQGLASTIWGAFLVLSPDSLFGADLTLGSGLVLAVGGLIWHVSALGDREPAVPIEIPIAVAVRSSNARLT